MARKKLKHSLAGKTGKSSYNYPLILGILLLIVFSGWKYHNARILSFNIKEAAKASNSGIKPVYIKSYPIGVDVDIKDTVINNGVWGIHPHSANYLTSSAGLGGKGNTILYGHNKNEILGPLRWINVGAKIEILGSDNNTYNYEVVKTDTVSPDNLDYIKPTETEELLTLYTCVGFLDSQRFIVVAKRI